MAQRLPKRTYAVEINQAGIFYGYDQKTYEIVAKQCNRCNEWRFLNQFNNAGKGFAGKHSACKKCHRKRDRWGRLLWA
ncbi:hypothetical protein [Peribacillus muralis]|uniref:hypothetical protein n=1 Tax=Peribacillus muralis TaxID=264697 RepID=UPI00366CF0FD